MEFFSEANNPALDIDKLQSLLSISRLPDICQSITSLITDNGDSGVIYCLWGEFIVNRELIKDGVRFSLPNCPNALCWTITCSTENVGEITTHCTINTKTHDEGFIESIKEFVDDWAAGLSNVPA